MLSKLATYAVKLATYGATHNFSGLINTLSKLSALTLTTIQTRQTTIHNNGGFGVAFTA